MAVRNRSYSELITMPSFGDRLKYLQLWDNPHVSPRHISNGFYKSNAWLRTREDIMVRDMGYDLGVWGVDIQDRIVDGIVLPGIAIVHHINPITEEDIEMWSDDLLDPENLITTSLDTHNAIHYKPKTSDYVERQAGDTLLWRR